jgi:hypothetical protein
MMVSSLIRKELLTANGLSKSFMSFASPGGPFRPIGCLCSIAWRPIFAFNVCLCTYGLTLTCPTASSVYIFSGHVVEGVDNDD